MQELSKAEELALIAALVKGDEAIRAWDLFNRSFTVDDLCPRSVELVPLLQANLSALGVTDSAFGKMRGYYRKTWYRNQLFLNRLGELIAALNECGITPVLCHSNALVPAHYESIGLRSLEHFEMAIRPEHFQTAHDAMMRLGLRRFEPAPSELRTWGSPLNASTLPDHETFWSNCTEIKILDRRVCILSAMDQLTQTLLALDMVQIPLTIWIADVTTILQRCEFNITEFLCRVRTTRLAVPVSRAARTLLKAFPQNIELLDRLKTIQPTHYEHVDRAAHRAGGIFLRLHRRLQNTYLAR